MYVLLIEQLVGQHAGGGGGGGGAAAGAGGAGGGGGGGGGDSMAEAAHMIALQSKAFSVRRRMESTKKKPVLFLKTQKMFKYLNQVP
jgi:hypothetical protein